MNKKPNLFLVGFPKCGTTSLWVYLKSHPEIYMCPIKEPRFFGTSNRKGSKRTISNLKDYLGLFKEATKEKVIGEASVTYINNPSSATKIHDFNPNSKILILVRNPVEYLRSLYQNGRKNGLEKETDFKKAFKNSKYLPYSSWVKMSKKIKRYIRIFGKEKVKIIVLEELIKKPKKTYKELLCFLDVDTSVLPASFKNYNPSKITMKFPVFLSGFNFDSFFIKLIKKITSKKTQKKLQIMKNWCFMKKKRIEFKDVVRKKLKKDLTNEVKELSKLTKKDLIKLWQY